MRDNPVMFYDTKKSQQSNGRAKLEFPMLTCRELNITNRMLKQRLDWILTKYSLLKLVQIDGTFCSTLVESFTPSENFLRVFKSKQKPLKRHASIKRYYGHQKIENLLEIWQNFTQEETFFYLTLNSRAFAFSSSL